MGLASLLSDPVVAAITGLIVLPVVLILVLWLVVVFIKKIVREHPIVEETEPFKYQRYEASNPPSGEAKTRVSMQYLGYLIAFLALEPIVVLSFIVFNTSKLNYALQFYGIFLAVYIPFLAYAVYESRKIWEWMWR
ncbi:MAG: NADH-quinone oxidoreductase subunit A [Desulfurococcales archaeon]|nr:NADH-quinone oxidoreductase subunit A [Desulfurococcales archaeon]